MVTDFIRAQFEPDDLVELRLLPSGRQQYTTSGKVANLLADLRAANGNQQNVYIGANPRKGRGGKDKDVAVARSVFVDVEQITPTAALDRVKGAGLPVPTITLNSGHGVHCYWRLADPMADLAMWTLHQKGLAARLQGDSKVCNPSRVMRLPGFVNHKPPAAECVLIDADPQRRYRLEELTVQQREQRQPSEQRTTETTEAIASVDSVLSVDSVSLCYSVRTRSRTPSR